jgi:hypothetical protein
MLSIFKSSFSGKYVLNTKTSEHCIFLNMCTEHFIFWKFWQLHEINEQCISDNGMEGDLYKAAEMYIFINLNKYPVW